MIDSEKEKQQNRQRISILIPLLFIAVLWVVHLTQWAAGLDLGAFGIFPRTVSGLRGILFAPLLHGGFSHLISNSIPLLVLGAAMIYFYRAVSYKVIIWIWLVDGIGVWLMGRPAYHIGASGLVYGMASFLFFSGLLRKNRQLTALSLAVVFVYGSIIWGIIPLVESISWEAHLFGLLAGIGLSVYYLKKGPADDPVPEWMDEHDDENRTDNLPESKEISSNPEDESRKKIIYTYRDDKEQSD